MGQAYTRTVIISSVVSIIVSVALVLAIFVVNIVCVYIHRKKRRLSVHNDGGYYTPLMNFLAIEEWHEAR